MTASSSIFCCFFARRRRDHGPPHFTARACGRRPAHDGAHHPQLAQANRIDDVDDAGDGAAALTKMRAKRYGLVISDWNMETMTGYDFLREVRGDPGLKQTPFIMVTAEIQDRQCRRGEERGRQQLHRQAIRRPHPESQDRIGVCGDGQIPAIPDEPHVKLALRPSRRATISPRPRAIRACRRSPQWRLPRSSPI